MSNEYSGALISFVSAVFFGFLPIFGVYAFRTDITLSTFLFLRFFLASVVLFSFTLLRYKSIRVGKKELLGLFILGFFCYNGQSRSYLTSVKYVSASLAVLLLYTHPMIVAVLSSLINKVRLSKSTLASVVICFIGLIMVLSASEIKLELRGVFFGLLAACFYSLYIIIGERVLKTTPAPVATSYITLFASIGMLLTGLISNDINFSFSADAWLPILGITFVATVLAALFFFIGVEKIGGTKASIISMSEPFATIIFSVLLLSESLSFIQLVGGLIIIGGSLIVVMVKDNPLQNEQVVNLE